jgi:hypothetical protein
LSPRTFFLAIIIREHPMKHAALLSLPIFAAGCLAVSSAKAADLGGYEESETYIERPAPVIARERVIIEHRYYEPYYEPRYIEEVPIVTYERPYWGYYAYPRHHAYGYARRFHHARFWHGYRHW